MKPLPFALYANDKLDVCMKANMFLHCFLRQVIISLSSMSCCNQALTRFANNVKGIAHPWTLQIKTRPEQKTRSLLRVSCTGSGNVLWISNSSSRGSGQALSPRSPSMFPFLWRRPFLGYQSWNITTWYSHLRPAWLEVLVVLFWGMIGKANNTSILGWFGLLTQGLEVAGFLIRPSTPASERTVCTWDWPTSCFLFLLNPS